MTTALFAYHRVVERNRDLFDQVRARLAQRISDVQPVVALSPEDLYQRAKALKNVREIIAAGGDGLLRDLVNLFARWNLPDKKDSEGCPGGDERPDSSPVTFGLIPLGTGNELGRGLKIPLDARRAAEFIGGKTTTIFPGTITILDGSPAANVCAEIYPPGQPLLFVNSAGTGIDSGTVMARQGFARLGLDNYLVIFLAGVLPRLDIFHAAIYENGSLGYEGETCWVVGLKGPCLGGGIVLMPTVHPEKAELRMMVVKGASRLRVVSEIPRVLSGRASESPLVRIFSGSRFCARFDKPRPISVDGDIVVVARAIEIGIGPPLRMFVPDGN